MVENTGLDFSKMDKMERLVSSMDFDEARVVADLPQPEEENQQVLHIVLLSQQSLTKPQPGASSCLSSSSSSCPWFCMW